MTGFATRAEIMQKLARGEGVLIPAVTPAGLSITNTSNANDGFHFVQIQSNSIGSTLPGTIVGFQLPPSPPNEIFLCGYGAGSTVGNTHGLMLARIYKLGTVDLTATGDKFTHDAATFPVLRTNVEGSSKPVKLTPLIQLTTAPTVTAPAIIVKTNAGGTGYVNQDGSNVVGTLTLTYPSATTVNGTTYPLKLEVGDSGVHDVSAIQVTTASTTGAATVWGMEELCPLAITGGTLASFQDCLFAGLNMPDLAPAVATSGTATSALVVVHLNTSTDVYCQWIWGVLNS